MVYSFQPAARFWLSELFSRLPDSCEIALGWVRSPPATRSQVDPDYEPSVGEINRWREQANGTQSGDPARGARIIVEVVGLDDPPRRLLLRADAVAQVRDAAAARAAELEQWAELSASADFPSQS